VNLSETKAVGSSELFVGEPMRSRQAILHLAARILARGCGLSFAGGDRLMLAENSKNRPQEYFNHTSELASN